MIKTKINTEYEIRIEITFILIIMIKMSKLTLVSVNMCFYLFLYFVYTDYKKNFVACMSYYKGGKQSYSPSDGKRQP